MESKTELYYRGKIAVKKFIEINSLREVSFVEDAEVGSWFGVCAYYRHDTIYIDIPKCAAIGVAGRAWSYPGHIIDRTPFGVVAHELGHHIDVAHGTRPGVLSRAWREETREDEITSYSPNTNEWFAEIFRLFITNPDLLRIIRPKMFAKLRGTFLPIENRKWDEVVTEERQQSVIKNKIARLPAQENLL